MKNSKLRRVLMLMACAVLLVCLSVGATLAYLTHETQEVKNTFTVGDIEIKLDEEKVDLYGNPLATPERTTTGNKYKLLPGHKYVKDPTVTVVAESEEAYVRIIATVSEAHLKLLREVFPDFENDNGTFNLAALVEGWVPATWEYVVDVDAANAGKYEFRYTKTVNTVGKGDQTLESLFTHIVVPGVVENDELAKLEDVEIIFVAHAIQADGFDGDVNKAWEAFDGQNK